VAEYLFMLFKCLNTWKLSWPSCRRCR